jgi:steroid delta-isomerase-like uncharacterized protein
MNPLDRDEPSTKRDPAARDEREEQSARRNTAVRAEREEHSARRNTTVRDEREEQSARRNTAVRDEREEIVLRHMQSENAHDFDTTIATFKHPRYELIATGAVHDGEAAVREYFRQSRTAFPDQRNELIALHHADDAVIAEFWLLGTHKGPLQGIEPTGREFRCRMTAFFLFEGTELVCERVYFDTATILRQLTA